MYRERDVYITYALHPAPKAMMRVELGPFGSAAEACDYCFGSFTKQGDKPAGPVAPFCVCMAYPEAGGHNMFCATPPSAAGYIADKKGQHAKFNLLPIARLFSFWVHRGRPPRLGLVQVVGPPASSWPRGVPCRRGPRWGLTSGRREGIGVWG